MKPAADLIGKIFDRLKVLAFVRKTESHHYLWKCICECGKFHIASTAHLQSGGVRSCGCLNDEKRRTKHGDPKDRFWLNVYRTKGCWIWRGRLYPDGYGVFKAKGIYFRAHRYAWAITKGIIPTGMQVLHRCDNPICVNPEHLFLGTHQDNMTDKKLKGRATGRRKLVSK